jgi:iron complex outermembrane receptor protein
MKLSISRALCASTALASGLLFAHGALAQSSGTAVVEELVITAGGQKNFDGAIIAETEPKSRATIGAEFISRQAPGQSVLDTINLLPGVNFNNNDAYGSSGGDLTIRGVDSQRIALLQDGMPLNDTGNYAQYSSQQLDSDLVERVTVNLGTTDVDSPTAAAAGGTINYSTKRAAEDFGVRAEVGFGSNAFARYYGTIESGRIGPFGTKIWVSGLYTRNDLFTPHDSDFGAAGQIKKKQFNARIDQEIGSVGEVSLMATYNEARNNFINRFNKATFDRRGVTTANLPDTSMVAPSVCVRPAPRAGLADVDNSAGNACPSNYYDFSINPSNTGNIRGLSKWNFSDNLTFTFDPYFQYTLANGGGAQLWSERDAQLRGNTAAVGVDLNGDGDTLDTVYLYRPNTTNTRRYGLTSSLIYKFNDDQTFRVAYTFDKGRHRQTGDVGFIGADGTPESPFGGKDGYGTPVMSADGLKLRRRDRASVAMLNQVAAEYRGRFLDDKFQFVAGVRAPFLKRELNNFCYQQNTFNAYCTTQVPTPVAGTNDGTGQTKVTFPQAALNSSAALQYGRPRSFTRKYDDILPNLGMSYEFAPGWTVLASYAETLSAPRTDDLYDQVLVDPGPEHTSNYDVGVRYSQGPWIASVSVFRNNFKNRIERVLDEPSGIAFSQNVGDVRYTGVDGAVGFKPLDTLSIYASASYLKSEILQDIANASAGAPLATKGKSIYEIPKFQGGVRVQWDPMEALSLGVQGKFVGRRFTNLVNTEGFDDYALWDADVRLNLSQFGMEKTYLQANVRNLFDERYLGDISPNLTGTALAQPGYRRTFILTLHYEY